MHTKKKENKNKSHEENEDNDLIPNNNQKQSDYVQHELQKQASKFETLLQQQQQQYQQEINDLRQKMESLMKQGVLQKQPDPLVPAFAANKDNSEHKDESSSNKNDKSVQNQLFIDIDNQQAKPQPKQHYIDPKQSSVHYKYNPFHYSPYYQPKPKSKYDFVDEILETYEESDTLTNVFEELAKADPQKENTIKAKAAALDITNVIMGPKTQDNEQRWQSEYAKQYGDLIKKLLKVNEKVPTCDLEFHGNHRRDHDKLSTLVKKFKSWVELNNIQKSKWLGVWVTNILQGKALDIYYRRIDDIAGDLGNLLQFLQTAFSQKHKLHEIKHELQIFQIYREETYAAYIQRFITLIEDFIWEKKYANTYGNETWTPELPTDRDLYVRLLKGINNRDVEIEITKLEAGNTQCKLAPLMDNIISVTKCLNNGAFNYIDDKRRKRYVKDYRSSKYSRHQKHHNHKSANKRKKYADRKNGKRNKRYKDDPNKWCNACNQSGHTVRWCTNKKARTDYIMKHKLCKFCAGVGHQLKDCPNKKNMNDRGGGRHHKKAKYYQNKHGKNKKNEKNKKKALLPSQTRFNI